MRNVSNETILMKAEVFFLWGGSKLLLFSIMCTRERSSELVLMAVFLKKDVSICHLQTGRKQVKVHSYQSMLMNRRLEPV
jgi:hypothetical protein